MSDPNFDTYVSVMHALFALEDQYGLHAYRDESGVPQLMFKDKGHDSLNMLDNIGAWLICTRNSEMKRLQKKII